MPYVYTTTTEYRRINPILIEKGRAGRLGLQLMPDRTSRRARVRWTIKDNGRGLQNLRGLDGSPVRVVRVGDKTYEFEPGYYGDFINHTEQELTEAAGQLDPNSDPIDIAEMIADDDQELLRRELDRKEWVAWQMFLYGIISIYKGTTLGYRVSFTQTTYNATVPWSTIATATPIADFLAVQLLGRGTSNNFGGGATAIMNSVTASRMVGNTNAADLGGRRGDNGGTFNTLTDVSQFLVAKNLPKIQTYDDGWIDDLGTFQIWIPNNVILVVASRPDNDPLAEYVLTRNINKNATAGGYRYVKNFADGINAPVETPPHIETHRGHNGGPAIYRPSAFIKMTVGTVGA